MEPGMLITSGGQDSALKANPCHKKSHAAFPCEQIMYKAASFWYDRDTKDVTGGMNVHHFTEWLHEQVYSIHPSGFH